MLNIKYFKLLIFVVFFLLSLNFVFAAYPAESNGECRGNQPAVSVGEWCYDCSTVSDGVCPNDFSDNVCNLNDPQQADIDCVSAPLCSEQKKPEFCSADLDGCTWCQDCKDGKAHSSQQFAGGPFNVIGNQCKDGTGKTCEYHCVENSCGAQCSEGATGIERGYNADGKCEERSWTCDSTCKKSETKSISECSFANNCALKGSNACGECSRSSLLTGFTTSGDESSITNGCGDGIDNDCDGKVDCQDTQCSGKQGAGTVSYYVDTDKDGYGSGNAINFCGDPGVGYSTQAGDCNNNDASVYPTATEICDGKNNDCNDKTADGSGEIASLNSDQDGVCVNSRRSCIGGKWQDSYISVTSYEATESSCNDGKDNDCDREKDWDTWRHRGPEKGDNNCAVGVIGISVSNGPYFTGDQINISCTATASGINSVRAFVGTTECVWNDDPSLPIEKRSEWNGNTAVFKNCALSNTAETKIIECTIDRDKSYQSEKEQTTSITVQNSDCGSYGSSTACPSQKCDWCVKCSPTSPNTKWNGLSEDSCVNKGSCSSYSCNVFQTGETGNTCGATCDDSIGCTPLDRCNGAMYQTRTGSCIQNTCGCNFGSWEDTNCLTSKQKGCVTQCTSDGKFCSASEANQCSNKINDDCDATGNFDYAGSGNTKGDNDCSVSVLSAGVSKTNPFDDEPISVYCKSSAGVVRSIFAFVDLNKDGEYQSSENCGWVDGRDNWGIEGQASDVAVFKGCNLGNAGSKNIYCSIYDKTKKSQLTADQDRSFQSGTDKSVSIDVKSSDCTTYTYALCPTSASRCKKVTACDGTKYSGGEDRCVAQNTVITYGCSFNEANNIGQCGASCDADSGNKDSNVDYCKQPDGDIYNRINGCNLDACQYDDGSATDTLSQSCTNTCSDSDNGQVFETKGTITDNDKCSSGSTCPSSTFSDSCSGNSLTEYLCSNNNVASVIKNCNDFDNKQVSGNSCSWTDGSCGDGACNSLSSSIDCSTYRDTNGNDGVIKESLATANRCQLGCTGENCCSTSSYTASGSCTVKTIGGAQFTDYRDAAGNNVWGTPPTQELTCNDGFDNDCDGAIDCLDTDCAGRNGPGNPPVLCCQARSDCPADGAEGFTGCVDDNTRNGAIGSFTCEQFECKSSTVSTQVSCDQSGFVSGCCFPSVNQQGLPSAKCFSPGKSGEGKVNDGSSVFSVDNDQPTEVCSTGNWVGANCQGSNCKDDGTAPHPSYNCASDADCQGDIGQCGEEVCLNNVCTVREKVNKKQICEREMPKSYQCAAFDDCSAATNYNCQYLGVADLCSIEKNSVVTHKNLDLGYDAGCTGPPAFLCEVDICVSEAVTTNPCCLCYSQCIEAANDPSVAPESTSECNLAKNKQYVLSQCPFLGGS